MSNRWNELPPPDRNKFGGQNEHPVLPPPSTLAHPPAPQGQQNYYLPSISQTNMRYPLPSIPDFLDHQGYARGQPQHGPQTHSVGHGQPAHQHGAQGPAQGQPQASAQPVYQQQPQQPQQPAQQPQPQQQAQPQSQQPQPPHAVQPQAQQQQQQQQGGQQQVQQPQQPAIQQPQQQPQQQHQQYAQPQQPAPPAASQPSPQSTAPITPHVQHEHPEHEQQQQSQPPHLMQQANLPQGQQSSVPGIAGAASHGSEVEHKAEHTEEANVKEEPRANPSPLRSPQQSAQPQSGAPSSNGPQQIAQSQPPAQQQPPHAGVGQNQGQGHHTQAPSTQQQASQPGQPGLPGQQGPPGPGMPGQDYYMYQYGQNMSPMQAPQMPGYMPPHTDYRPLNVTDALSYLDQVKLQFRNQPDVYNHFLDIMKDFKSHSIDTPGVIDRVSSLFRGHTNLIQGFNTFLPAGYRIECSLDPMDPNPIRVTTPMGVTRPDGEYEQRWNQPQPVPLMRPGRFEYEQSQSNVSSGQSPRPAQGVPQLPPGSAGPASSQPGPQPQHNGGQGMSQLHAAAVDQRRQDEPAEFGHAIHYVNKIKNRFSSQPEIYKAFLEILQTYQREQLRISDVYAQITHLFREAPDLLNDFRHFLPDTSSYKGEAGGNVDQVRLPPVGNFGPPAMQQPIGMAGPQQGAPIITSPKKPQQLGPGGRGRNSSPSGIAPMLPYQPGMAQGSAIETGPSDEPAMIGTAQQLPPPSRKISLVEEISFFDKVKKLLPKQNYVEFLKIINLFTQRIIDLETLVERVDGFIGQHQDLLTWFKKFVGYEGKPLKIENIAFKKHMIDLSQCRSYGPSYCLLPKTEMYMPCSGRDEMCWEVLNDEWVGHPTWASEDSGFVSHRKNQYEDILYRIEEERHEYDHYIGANQRTIQVLETIANRIANMTVEEQAEFKLPVGLGHQSKIYQKVINKIYDKKNGAEVIEALHENPGVAVPIVLRRLKQKDEEWKRAQREWNKVWRETEQKVFFKSLDHIGLTFKQTDRKQLTSRALLSEIMAIKAEQSAKRKTIALPAPKSQIQFAVDDESVMIDLWKLLVKFLEHGGNYSAHDRELMNTFLKNFLPLFFGLKAGAVESVYGPAPITNPSLKRPLEEDVGFGGVFKRSKQDDSDEEKKSDEEIAEAADAIANSVSESKVAADEVEQASLDAQQPWLKFERVTPPLELPPAARSSYNLFSNTGIYLFMRIFQIIYSRLAEVKAAEEIVQNETKVARSTEFALELHLYDSKLEDMGLLFSPENMYSQALTLCERLVEGDVEPQWFEESLRQAYRNRAYKLYTIDKALYSLIKQLHTIVTSPTSGDVLMLFERDRKMAESDIKAKIVYRMQVRQAVGPDEPMFRIEWNTENQELSFQYLGAYDLTLKGVVQAQKQWEYYLTSYMMSVPTEGIPLDKIKAPLLQRATVADVSKDYPFVVIEQGLQARVSLETYKLFFEKGTSDYIMRSRPDWTATRKSANEARDKRWKEVKESYESAETEDGFYADWLANGVKTEEVEPVVEESDLRSAPLPSKDDSGVAPAATDAAQAEAEPEPESNAMQIDEASS